MHDVAENAFSLIVKKMWNWIYLSGLEQYLQRKRLQTCQYFQMRPGSHIGNEVHQGLIKLKNKTIWTSYFLHALISFSLVERDFSTALGSKW